MKLKNFYASKDINKRVKRQPTEWDRIFTNHLSEEGMISRIYKEFLHPNNNKKNQIAWSENEKRS